MKREKDEVRCKGGGESSGAPELKRQRTEEESPASASRISSSSSNSRASDNGARGSVKSETTDEAALLKKAALAVGGVLMENDVGAAFSLVPGETTIEVMWELHGESVWWEGLVVEKTARKHVLDDHVTKDVIEVPTYIIRYVPREPDYPEHTECEVIFTEPHRMMDVTYDGSLFWKIKGDPWLPREDEWASGDPPLEHPGEVEIEGNMSVEERARRTAAQILDPVISGSAITKMMAALQPSKRCMIADRFVSIKAAIAKHLQEKFSANPAFVVDDDAANELIQTFFAL